MMASIANPSAVGFYVLAAVAVFASLRVVTQHNPVHSILSLIVSLLAVAGIFFIFGASFAGVLEIIVYAGAILVLFVFVIMMLNLGHQVDKQESAWLTSETWAVPTALTMVIGVVLLSLITMDSSALMVDGLATDNLQHIQGINQTMHAHLHGVENTDAVDSIHSIDTFNTIEDNVMITGQAVTAKAVGTQLFSEYLMLVEVSAMLLLAALVTAYHLGKKVVDDEMSGHNNHITNPKNRRNKNNSSSTHQSSSSEYHYSEIQADDFVPPFANDGSLTNSNTVSKSEKPSLSKESS